MNPITGKRTSNNRLSAVLVLLLAAAGGCLYYFLNGRKPEIQKPLVGIVLGKIEVTVAAVREYRFDRPPPASVLIPSGLKPEPTPSPTLFLKPVEVPGLRANLESDLRKQVEEAGIPLVKLPTTAEKAAEDFDHPGPPTVDMTDKSILRLQLNTYRREGRIYYRAELSLEQPVYLSPGAPKYTWEVERAPTWRWTYTDFGKGVPESDADLKIRIVIGSMMDKFVQTYEYAKEQNRARS